MVTISILPKGIAGNCFYTAWLLVCPLSRIHAHGYHAAPPLAAGSGRYYIGFRGGIVGAFCGWFENRMVAEGGQIPRRHNIVSIRH